MKLTTIYYGSDIIRYTVQTFGCKVNQYESASVAKAMDEHGYEKTDDIFTADIVIINSCSVTENSDKKAAMAQSPQTISVGKSGTRPVLA